MRILAHHFHAGGSEMYWVLACSVVAWICTVQHVVRLYRPRPRTAQVLAVLQRHLSVGDVEGAARWMVHTKGEVALIAVAALKEAIQHPLRIEAAITAHRERARSLLRRGLPFLFVVAQVATLFGLLGAVTGLFHGFQTVAPADAESRATALAAAIGESMNCTAFGILVSLTAHGAWWVLDTRADVLSADLDHAAHAIGAMLITYRDRLRLLGERPAVLDGTYRTTE